MTERTHGRDLTPEQLAETISEFVNGHGADEFEQVAEAVTRNHRTIQQQTFGLVLALLRGWSKSGWDARNELTVKLAKAIVAPDLYVKFENGHEMVYSIENDLQRMPLI